MRIKDLGIIWNREIDDILLIDNAAYSFGHHIGNGIPILSFFEDRSDKELLYLSSYLESIANSPNLREANSKAFQLENLNSSEIQKYIHIYKNLGENDVTSLTIIPE